MALLIPPDTQSRAFATQYTALILILLTFILGTISTPSPACLISGEPSSQGVCGGTDKQAVLPQKRLIGEVPLNDLFTPSGRLQSGLLSGVMNVLHNHDVTAEIVIPVLPDEGMGTALDKSMQVEQLIEESGVARASEVYVVERGSREIVARLYTETDP